MSLFVDNIIFEDQNTNESEEELNDQDSSNQIESNLLNLIDDEPEASQSFEKEESQSQEKSDQSDDKISQCSENSDIIGKQL